MATGMWAQNRVLVEDVILETLADSFEGHKVAEASGEWVPRERRLTASGDEGT